MSALISAPSLVAALVAVTSVCTAELPGIGNTGNLVSENAVLRQSATEARAILHPLRRSLCP